MRNNKASAGSDVQLMLSLNWCKLFFKSKESTLACFIDLEKEYDSVWREGPMVKLSRLGVNSRMWSWLFFSVMQK